jgi:hypothetical protein
MLDMSVNVLALMRIAVRHIGGDTKINIVHLYYVYRYASGDTRLDEPPFLNVLADYLPLIR